MERVLRVLRRLVAAGLVVSFLSVRCMRSWRPFCCGWPGWMRSRRIPKRSHQTASRDSPNSAQAAANGGQRRPAGLVAPAFASLDEAVAIERGVDRARRGRRDHGVVPDQLVADLRCAPGGVLLLDPQDRPLDVRFRTASRTWPLRVPRMSGPWRRAGARTDIRSESATGQARRPPVRCSGVRLSLRPRPGTRVRT